MRNNFIELNGICGSRCLININEIADIREQEVLGHNCTIILYSSGKKLIVNHTYEEVKQLVLYERGKYEFQRI